MSYHQTESGYVSLIASWRPGQAMPAATRRIDVIIYSDDASHSVWRVAGSKRDAAVKLGNLDLHGYYGCRDAVVTFDGAHAQRESTPLDFWTEENDEFRPNLDQYPNVVAY